MLNGESKQEEEATPIAHGSLTDTPTEEAVQPSHVETVEVQSSAPSSLADSADSEERGVVELEFSFGRYVGQVDPLTQLRSGEGTLYYNSGNTYTGEWCDGAAHGFGEKTYKNGDVFRGMWSEGKRCGRGSYLHKEGHFFEGMYERDMPNGYGVLTTVSGDRYAGEWKDGLKCGKGRETLKTGQVFVGKWKGGKKQGAGKVLVPGAKRYIYGVWHDDKFFRELTEEELANFNDGEEGDQTVGPTRATAAFDAPDSSTDITDFAQGLTDKAMKGIEALENKLEAWGRALEKATTDQPAENTNAPQRNTNDANDEIF
ncbi:phosphatidylinositol-4-phosphate 5-kinase [Angomonas deanei]|uniref:MORN repeat, putative n=1 Tax=Angomonas deanei TaxID=59799 RepID=A0A7G2C634_9TRYP|nr:phosphatidylinositol-4-phosphate 5-kinase [Angomonas deanei]CAD2215258.1 MORN repeat, putative [Angomonas deanei]|eukprot:EPY22041.1 phosphatidylinositol-4-phosphate 5-kinase [Angomonas deanei]